MCSWSLTWRVRAQLIAVEKLRSPLPLELLLYRLQNERDRERWRNEERREKESVTHAKRWDSFRLLWFSDAVIRAKLNIRSRLPQASVCVGVHFNVWRSWDILQWRLREDAWAAGTVNPVMRGGVRLECYIPINYSNMPRFKKIFFFLSSPPVCSGWHTLNHLSITAAPANHMRLWAGEACWKRWICVRRTRIYKLPSAP